MSWTPSKMGKKGGATKGPSKVRGDSEYYKAIRAKKKAAPKSTSHNNGLTVPPASAGSTQTAENKNIESAAS